MTETGPRQTIRAIVASFLFTDLVAFSKGTAAEQYAAKASLSEILHRNLAALRESDYWIKDTGDGALIAFVSNPEHALYMALAIGRDYQDAARAAAIPSKSLRTGLHLGTVKELIDIEGRRNFIGDGINAAKRIMDFAGAGQIAASRSFFDAIANLDAAYAALFQHLGASDDKHGRPHELYAIIPNDAVRDRLKTELAAEREEAPNPAANASSEVAAGGKVPGRISARIFRPAPLILTTMAAVVGIASLFFVMSQREADPRVQPAKSEPASARTPGESGTPIKASPGDKTEPKSAQMAGVSTPTEAPQGTVAATGTGSPLAPGGPSGAGAPGASAAPELGRIGSANGSTTALPAEATPNQASNAGEHRAEVTPTTAPPAPTMIRAAPGTKTRVGASVSASSENDASAQRASPRCSRIVEKAAVGEPLTQEEKRDLANSCR